MILEERDPKQTYLDHYDTVWIGSKWDIAYDGNDMYALYRKGNYVWSFHNRDVAIAVIADEDRIEEDNVILMRMNGERV